MSDLKTYKLNSFFKLYDKDGLQISFSLCEDEVEPHLAQLEGMKQKLYGMGYRQNPEELDNGERIQEVDGWVLSETSKGQPCVHLYKDPLQWKVVTVWEEDLPKLPLTTVGVKPFLGAAPEREHAMRLRVLNNCDLKIVLAPDVNPDGTPRLTQNGKPRMRFDRVYGQEREPATATEAAATGTNAYDPIFKKLSPQAQKMVNWARKLQLKHPGEVNSAEQYQEVLAILDESLESPGAAEWVLRVLSGLEDHPENISRQITEKLLDWIPTHIETAKGITENPTYNEAYAQALTTIMVAIKGEEPA